MTEVRIRHESDIHPVSLGDIPLLEVDKVLPLLKRWGVMTKFNGVYDPTVPNEELSGQFTVESGSAAYFEVQIHDDE